MSYFDWLESRLDYITGTPCLNCECSPAAPEDLFCSDACRNEYEGTDGGECVNGSPTCTPDDPCVFCYDTGGTAESIDATYAIRQDTD